MSNTKLTGQARQAAAQDCREYYEAGASVRSTAARFGRSYGVTYLLLQEAGTVFRDKLGRPREAAV
ncbi:helix-turn-helix domain-containing protein [Streptomyces sp. NPDC005799]|uniref:helix-turn-helix domain-containing protein n=1 Tax=Streptomyces sp. NPDC005799 TaxID=3154678 RepID=UPI0033C3AFB8